MFTYTKNQITYPILFLMISDIDHIAPALGLTPTVLLSKNGGSFAAPAGAVAEVGNGWYKLVPNLTDFNTLGPLLLHATSELADPTDASFQVVTGLADLGPTQIVDITGNIQGSVGSVLAPVTCKTSKCRCGCS